MRKYLPALALAAATLALSAGTMVLLGRHQLLLNDFRAFYCGGSAVLHGANPYLSSSLVPCESAPAPFGLSRAAPGMVEPVPLPGYAFFALVPFALLPFVPAAALWTLVSVVLCFASAAGLARLAGRTTEGVIAVFGVGFATVLWTYGETAPIALLALTVAAFALRRSRFALVAAALCLCAVLPHVAAPVMIAVFLWERRSRVPLIAGGLVLLALDMAIGGPRTALAYFTAVLPAHAQAEIPYITQYSLTWMLHAAGLSGRAALLWGNLSYAGMAAFGVWCAGRLRQRFDDPAFLAFVPAACAVIGGSFIHYAEILLALPAAVLLCSRTSGRAYAIACAALLLVAIPWQWVLVGMAIPSIVAAGCIAMLFLGLRPVPAAAAAAGAALICAAVVAVGAHFGPQMHVIVPAALPSAEHRLAQYGWGTYIAKHFASGGISWWVAKAPTWIGLALLAFGCAYVLPQKDFVAPSVVEQVPASP